MKLPGLFNRTPKPAPPQVCTRCGRLQDGTAPGCAPQPDGLVFGFEALDGEVETHQPRCPGCQAWQACYHHAGCTWAARHQP
jgi:hypothetical protein